MCIESLTKMLLGRKRASKMRRSWRFKKTADDKIGLLTDHDFDTEIDERATDYSGGTDNRVSSFDLSARVESNGKQLTSKQILIQHAPAESLEGYEMLPLSCNDNNLNERDASKSGQTATKSTADDDQCTFGSRENMSNDPNENQTFLTKHLYRLIQTSRRLSQKSYKEISRTVEQTTSEKRSSSGNLSDYAEAVEMQFETLEERCRYYWNSNNDSDDESHLDDHDRSCDSLSALDDTFLSSVTEVNSHETYGAAQVSLDEENSGANDSNECVGDLSDSFSDENTEINDTSCFSDSDDSFSDASVK